MNMSHQNWPTNDEIAAYIHGGLSEERLKEIVELEKSDQELANKIQLIRRIAKMTLGR